VEQAVATDARTSRTGPPTITETPSGKRTLPTIRNAVRDLPGYVAGRRAAGTGIAALASNESPFEPLPSVRACFLDGSTRVHRYPDPGAVELREAIAARFTPGTGTDEVVLGAGSIGVLQQLLSAVLEPGDEVVHAWRSFEAYPILVTVAGGRPVPVALTAQEHHDLPAMLAAIGSRTRAVLLCSPNNPTGTAISHPELIGFLTAVPPDVVVVLDEAYLEFVTGPDAARAVDAYREFPNLVVLRTFSKAYGLAGLRIGYAVARPFLAEGIRRTALPFAVTDLAQQAALASLAAREELAERVTATVEERTRLVTGLRALGLPVGDSAGNFVWLRMDDAEAASVMSTLTEAGILVRAYTGDGLRITVGQTQDTSRLLQALAGR